MIRSDAPRRIFVGLCTLEMFERLAYFGVRSVIPVYIMQADDPGGLHLTAAHKGTIYAWWFAVQSFLPTLAGSYADRYGHRRVLAVSIILTMLGYLAMAFTRGYWPFFGAVMVLAAGTALFKPSLQGALARILSRDRASLGWGIFYWIVNVGALAAPVMATLVLGDPHTQQAWRNLFCVSAALSLLNLTLLPVVRRLPTATGKQGTPWNDLVRTLHNILEPRLLSYLLILSGFCLMMFQLWDLQPSFINDWVDSTTIAERLQFLPESLYEY